MSHLFSILYAKSFSNLKNKNHHGELDTILYNIEENISIWNNIRKHISTWNFIRGHISTQNLMGEKNIFNPILSNRWYRGAHLNPSYFPLIFPTMTLKIHVVEHLHHNQLGLYTPKYTLNSLVKWGALIPTSSDCGYDANWGILCKD